MRTNIPFSRVSNCLLVDMFLDYNKIKANRLDPRCSVTNLNKTKLNSSRVQTEQTEIYWNQNEIQWNGATEAKFEIAGSWGERWIVSERTSTSGSGSGSGSGSEMKSHCCCKWNALKCKVVKSYARANGKVTFPRHTQAALSPFLEGNSFFLLASCTAPFMLLCCSLI